MSEETIINKVAESGLVTLNLEYYMPNEAEVVSFDLKSFLFMELILKEKEFRQALKQLDTSVYQNKMVAIHCTADAIIPMWAYMLVSSTLQPVAKKLVFGKPEEAVQKILLENISQIDADSFKDQRIVIKGCGEKHIPAEAYLEITNKLMPVAKTIMFGEPCSTVPVYKRPS
jgi:hypothetical protein